MYYCMYFYPNVYGLKLVKHRHRVFPFICYLVSTFIYCYIYKNNYTYLFFLEYTSYEYILNIRIIKVKTVARFLLDPADLCWS